MAFAARSIDVITVYQMVFGLLTCNRYHCFRHGRSAETDVLQASGFPLRLFWKTRYQEHGMRARITLEMIGDDGETIAAVTAADLTKATKGAEDLGLSLAEGKALLATLQQTMVETQVEFWLKENREIDGRRLRHRAMAGNG